MERRKDGARGRVYERDKYGERDVGAGAGAGAGVGAGAGAGADADEGRVQV